MNKKTKIIATIGPASDSVDQIKKLILSGVNIFRFNTKHSTIDWHDERIKRVQRISKELKKNIGIMIDLQGGETRIITKNEKEIEIKKNQIINIASSFFSQDILIVIPNKEIIEKLKKNDTIFIDDGEVELKIIEKKKKYIKARIIEGESIKNKKGVNFPKTKIDFPSFVEKDIKILNKIFNNNIDFVALSFVNSKNDVLSLRKELKKRKMKSLIVSKIEGKGAINKIDEIIESSDAIMIARGDLGIEAPIEELAYQQKKIINKSRKKRIPVIVATQMLHSMINNYKPTRAEVTDVANAVFDGADAVMLSEETALGKYPIKAVKVMEKIIKFNETKSFFLDLEKPSFNSNYTEFVVTAINNQLLKNKLKIKTAFVFTESGYTARVLSSFRPKIKIIAITNNKEVTGQLSLSYGVIPFYSPESFNNLELPKKITEQLKNKKIILKNETVAIFHGRYNKKPNLLNLFSLTKIR